ncbi:MAG: glycosyltransferase family 9 protein [Desulfurobacteriaceae bacterium]
MKLLLIRLSSLGDVALVSSVFSPLKKAGIEFDLLTFKPFGDLFLDDSRINRVIEVEREALRGLSGIREIAKELRSYDAVLDLHANLRTKLLTGFLSCPVFTYRKRSLLRRLILIFKPLKAKWLYVPELYSEPLKRLGIKADRPRPEIEVDFRRVERVRKLVPEERFVAVSPGARWPGKEYPLERLKAVVEILHCKGYRTVAVGGENEEEKGRELEALGTLNLCGKLKIIDSLAVLKLAAGVVSGDSAAVHLARSVKTPVVSIFGPTHPAFGFAPYSDEGAVITRNLPCSPCSLHGRTAGRRMECMEIEPEEVVEKLLSVVESAGRRES